MCRVVLAALVLLASVAAARAELFDARDWYRRIEAFTRSLVEPARPDQDVIAPPGNIDPKMAIIPTTRGAMRIIPPPSGGR